MAAKRTKVQAAGDLLARGAGLLSPLDDPRPLGRFTFYAEGTSWLPSGVEATAPLVRDPRCPRCPLGKVRKAVCMESHGPPGVPLLVMASPTERDDGAGGFVETGLAQEVLAAARRHVLEVRLTWAVRCAGGADPEEGPLAACRPFLAWELDRAAEAGARVVLLGETAARSVAGVAMNAQRNRRGWAVVRGAACHFVMHPGAGQRNRFLKRQFLSDLEWALTVPIGRRPDGVVEVLLTPERAVEWLEAVRPEPLVFDAEHWPKNPWAVVPEKGGGKFRFLALALCQDPAAPVVIPEEVLADERVVAALRRVMEDPAFPKLNQDAKHDMAVLWRAARIDVRGIEADTLIWARLMDSDAPNGLGYLQWKVGYGGAKAAGQVGAEDDDE